MAHLYRGAQSPREEAAFANFSSNPLSPPRNPNRMSGGMMSSNDARGSLTRRFTMNALPTLSPIGQQRRQAAGETQLSYGAYLRIAPSERKIRHIEGLLEQQRRIAAELEQVDDQTRREVEEGLRHERSVTQMIAQSEPTTPPEYQDGFSGAITRPNRYSTTSLSSQPGLGSRSNRSSLQLTSPSAGVIRPYTANTTSNLPSQSVPGSRRQSDDEEEEDDFLFGGYDSTFHRAAANPNRNSLPVISYDRKRNAADLSSTLGPLNTTSFLFDDDEKPSTRSGKASNKTSPPDTKTYLQVLHTADGFPKLIRREENGEPASAPSAALDLALAQASKSEQQVSERASGNRHRISLPPSALSSNGTIAPLNSILANAHDAKSAANNRRSMEVKFTAETKRPSLMASPPHSTSNGVSNNHVSYSTNDIPTLNTIGRSQAASTSVTSPASQSTLLTETSSDQSGSTINQFSSDNTSNRQSQDFTSITKSTESNSDVLSSHSSLQSSTGFGSMQYQDMHHVHSVTPSMPQYSQPAYHSGYLNTVNNVNALNNSMTSMSLNGQYSGQAQWSNAMTHYQSSAYNGYQQYPQNGQVIMGVSRSDNNRAPRKILAEEAFNQTTMADVTGQIYPLCKDQHGCRFLQKKLEERNEQDLQIIFDEVKEHFTELMVDPFGNYLCQRLLEYANDEQRTILVEKAVPAMTQIALNQHGTRALQRMIEFINTSEQTNLIISALRFDVVQLIQDLNGNHVIQKCLNHLSAHDAQFIFDAVGSHCVTVGTHRHGCCVLQRCVDHAAGGQKGALINHIIDNAFSLVQDPFGNYVVQYILDLSEPCFTEPLCRSFQNNVAILSKQKFSSNVIEKCLRCASPETRRMLIQEINNQTELEKLLRDSFANYVVQTAMDFADDETKALMFDNVRPFLPSIRHTPYGRRIQSKIQEYDGASGNGYAQAGMSANQVSSAAVMPPNGQQPSFSVPVGRANRMGMVGPSPQWPVNSSFGNGYGASGPFFNGSGSSDMNAPSPQRNSAYTFINGTQNYQNHSYPGPGFRGGPHYNHF